MKNLHKKTSNKETKFDAFMQQKVDNLNALRGGENPPPNEDIFFPPPPPTK